MLKGYLDEQECFSIADFTKVQSKLSGYTCRQQIEFGDKANKYIYQLKLGSHSFSYKLTINLGLYFKGSHILVGNKKSAIL